MVPQLGLGLALELRVPQADRHDGGEPFPDVLAFEVLLLLLQEVPAAGIAVDHVGQRLREALDVHPALHGGDAVGEGVDGVVVARVPLQRDLDLLALVGLFERRHLAEQRLLGGIEVLDEVDDPAVVLERRSGHRVGALVGEPDLEALVQEGHYLETLHHGLGPELGLVEDAGVGPEGHRGARPGLSRPAVRRGGSHRGDLARHPAALLELRIPVLALAVDLEHQPGGQGVHDGDAHAMEATGDLVALPPELPAGVEGGQDDLGRRDLGVLGVRTDRDAGAVVAHPAAAVGQQGYVDPGTASRHGLVDGVVHDLPDQVVQPGRARGTDVHPGTLADGLEAFEDRDVGLTVGGLAPFRGLVHLHCHRRVLSQRGSSRCVSNPRMVLPGLSVRTHHSTRHHFDSGAPHHGAAQPSCPLAASLKDARRPPRHGRSGCRYGCPARRGSAPIPCGLEWPKWRGRPPAPGWSR